jgi:hypothetical protein
MVNAYQRFLKVLMKRLSGNAATVTAGLLDPIALEGERGALIGFRMIPGCKQKRA